MEVEISVREGDIARPARRKPGDGQQVVCSRLDDKKLLRADDAQLSPSYVRDQTPLKRGEITTAELRGEYRDEPRLSKNVQGRELSTLRRVGRGV